MVFFYYILFILHINREDTHIKQVGQNNFAKLVCDEASASMQRSSMSPEANAAMQEHGQEQDYLATEIPEATNEFSYCPHHK